MTNHYFLTFFLTFIYTVSFGMKNALPPDSNISLANKTTAMYLIEEGKSLYMQGKIKDALIKFRQAGAKDPSTWKSPYWISICHYEMGNYGYSLNYAKEALKLNEQEVDKEVYHLLAGSYHRLGILDTALVHYEIALSKLSKLRSNELKLPLRVEQCRFAQTEFNTGRVNLRKRLKGTINSGYDDYAPVVFNEGKSMYFTSRRSNTLGGGLNPSDQEFFEDIYLAQWSDESQEWDSVTNELGKLNSTGFESMNTLSEDGSLAFITLNTTAVPNEKIRTKSSDICEVFRTTKGLWSSPKPIENKTITTSFFDGGATITADGNTLYFVSEQNAEKSQSDIFVSEKIGKKWGDAVPLPPSINSKGRETTPFITPDGKYLFFSSNSLPGMGDYDVFVVEKIGSSWGEPKNLGMKVNTVNNDTHFRFYESLGKAYMGGVEIVGEKASMDIYELTITLEELLNN